MLEARVLERMSIKELRQELRQLNATANIRVDFLKEAGERKYSEAVRLHLTETGIGSHFTVPNKASKPVLMARIRNVQEFLMSESSTVRGVQRGRERFFERTGGTMEDYRRYKNNYKYVQNALKDRAIILSSSQFVEMLEIIESSAKRGKALFEYIEKQIINPEIQNEAENEAREELEEANAYKITI